MAHNPQIGDLYTVYPIIGGQATGPIEDVGVDYLTVDEGDGKLVSGPRDSAVYLGG